MKKHLLILIPLLLAAVSPGRAQLLTSFGTNQLNTIDTTLTSQDFTPAWVVTSASQNANSMTVTSESAFTGGLTDIFTSPITLKDQNYTTLSLALTGELTAAAPSGDFQITLYDDNMSGGQLTFNNSLTFTYAWSSFSQSAVTSVLATNATVSGPFDGNVNAWALSVGSGPTENVSFQFDSLTAVPEPSTYALFGVGALALWVLRRRKALVS